MKAIVPLIPESQSKRDIQTVAFGLTVFVKTVFSIKEVIQPHLPVLLPCYDLTPITNSTVGGIEIGRAHV